MGQDEINAYPEAMEEGSEWTEGDLIVHLAGCWVKNTCKEQWKEFMGKRKTVAAYKKQKASEVKKASENKASENKAPENKAPGNKTA